MPDPHPKYIGSPSGKLLVGGSRDFDCTDWLNDHPVLCIIFALHLFRFMRKAVQFETDQKGWLDYCTVMPGNLHLERSEA